MERNRNWMMMGLICLSVILASYFNRWIFSFRYEPQYFENYYYHSQWNIPESPRTISDDDLYKFVGYRLVNGENPFNLNYEVPPAAKYLYGLAIKFWGNPYLFSYGAYLASLGWVFLVANLIFKRLRPALLSTLVFSLNPLLVSQIGQTMLDLPQTVFWLMHIYLFIRGCKSERVITVTAAGVCLGLMTGTKIGVYSPLVVLVDIAALVILRKNLKVIAMFLLGGGAGYLLAYAGYFMHHPNPIPWIRLHKQVVMFYLRSKVGPEVLNQMKTIFLNQYHGWWSPGQTSASSEWSVLIPAGFISLVAAFTRIKNIFRTNKSLLFLAAGSLTFLIVNSLVPFWMRYLVILLPGFAIFTVWLGEKHKWLLGVIIGLSLFSLANFYQPTGYATAKSAVDYIKIRSYRDLYRMLDSGSRKNITEASFEGVLSGVNGNFDYTEASIESAEETSFKLNLNYVTNIGKISYKPTISMVKEMNQWKIVWKWDYVLPEFDEQTTVRTIAGDLPTKEVYTKDNVLIAKAGAWPYMSVIPQEIGDWGESLKSMVKVDGLTMNKNWAIIRRVAPDAYPVGLRHILLAAQPTDIAKVSRLPGIKMKPTPYLIPSERFKDNGHVSAFLDQWLGQHPEYITTIRTIETAKNGLTMNKLAEFKLNSEDKVYLDKTLDEVLSYD